MADNVQGELTEVAVGVRQRMNNARAFVQRLLHPFHLLAALLWPMRAAITTCIIFVLAMRVDQTIEAVQVFGEQFWTKGWTTAFTIVCLLMVCLATWYTARSAQYRAVPNPHELPRWRELVLIFAPRVLGVVPMLSMAWAALSARAQPRTQGEVKGLLIWLALGLLAGAIGLIGLFIARRPAIRAVKKVQHRLWGTPSLAPARSPWLYRAMWLVALGFGLLLSVPATISQSYANLMGVLAILFSALAVFTIIGSYIVWWIDDWLGLPTLPLAVAVGVLLSLFNCNDNHEVRRLSVPATPVALVPTISDAFAAWLAERAAALPPGTTEIPVFLVAAEGGGIYAAYHTAGVLGKLDTATAGRFSEHLFAISGVSGGSVGASVYCALLAEQRALLARTPGPAVPVERDARAALSNDLLSRLLAFFLYPDLVQRFIPFVPGISDKLDRARGLELALEHALDTAAGGDRMSRGFMELYPSPSAERTVASVPLLLLNTTRVDTGERIVIAPVTFQGTRSNHLRTLGDVAPSVHIRWSTAAALSARFPLVTPAGTVSGTSFGTIRLADGGYFDNPGTATLIDVITAIKHVPPPPGFTFRLSVVQIGAKPGDERTKLRAEGLGESMSPIRALMNTRGARGRMSIRQLDATLAALPGDQRGTYSEYLLDTAADSIPLGWLLSKRSRAAIDLQQEGLQPPAVVAAAPAAD